MAEKLMPMKLIQASFEMVTLNLQSLIRSIIELAIIETIILLFKKK